MESRPTRLVTIATVDPDCAVIADAAEILRQGWLVAFPTETVYGLGADATSADAVAKIFEAKGRPSTNPVIAHVDSPEMALTCVAEWTDEAQALATAFWPGPLTLVLARSPLIPDIVTAGRDTVAVRMPRGRISLALILALGRPIAAPSANRSTGISPTLASHVAVDLGGRVDLILDGGPTEVGIESTVVSLTTREPHVLRPGPITATMIRHALGGARVREPDSHIDLGSTAATSPGQSPRHYAPRTPVFLSYPQPHTEWRQVRTARLGLLVLGNVPLHFIDHPEVFSLLGTPEEAARQLYATLQSWDRKGLDAIHVVLPPNEEAWRAVRDRLIRAAHSEAREP